MSFVVRLVCASLLGVVGAIASGQAPEPKLVTPVIVADPEVKLLDQEGPGKLFQVGEHLVCVLEGTPEEMGHQHGRLLAKQIRHGLTAGYTQKALYNRGYTREYINAQSERMEKHFPPEYIAEMKGIVKGLKAARVDDIGYEDVRVAVTQAELLHHPPNSPPELSSPAPSKELSNSCSNFAVWGKWTTDGRLLHGRNLDWPIDRSAQDGAVVLIERPKGGMPFMMAGWAGAIGSVSGMNAQGITLGEMTSSSTQETFDGLPLMLMMRRVLDSAKTLDEAVAILKRGPRTTGWNFIVGDGKKPDGRALEVDAVDCEVFTPMDLKESDQTGHWAMENAVRRTNHPCGLSQVNKLIDRYATQFNLSRDDLPAALLVLKTQNTWQRYDWLGKQIQAQPGKIDVPQALQLLANGPVKNNGTLHSWVFDPKNQTVYLSDAAVDPPVTATERPYTKISLAEWFR